MDLQDLPGEVLILIYEILDFSSSTKFIQVCKDFYYLTADVSDHLTDHLGTRRLYAYQHRAARYIKNFITRPENQIIRFNAVKGYGKTLLGLYLAKEFKELYNCFIIVPNEKNVGRFADELALCGLYNSDPNKCDFILGMPTRKKHWDAFQKLAAEDSPKIRITSVIRLDLIKVSNILFITDERHTGKMNAIRFNPFEKEISLSATTISDGKPYLSYYRPIATRSTQFIISQRPANILAFLRALDVADRPVVFMRTNDHDALKGNHKAEFNFWGGTGAITLKKYGKAPCITIVPMHVVECVNFNYTRRIVITTGVENIRTGRVVQLLGRVIRESSEVDNFIVETFTGIHCPRSLISLRVAYDIVRNGYREDDPNMKSTNHIEKIFHTLGKSLDQLTDTDLRYLFYKTTFCWKNVQEQSGLTIEELLNIGFLL